ncbi:MULTISPECIES: DUF5672 family protein [unclassified Sphingobium]|uniref:DUF5672 family protein n=1 Tax=unclassified Sphingobium TaxID=2611147 RepID=UPI002224F0C3|nr:MULTISPECIES: DUF5672 family protein [unclassified Sphingobium]MCW2396641.1 peptidoglycan/xylan/chitin deacetylase (PgdA/CDA1 family) [Sphingobium sp. B8D3B]MCW2420158.1 peptidoglycan/xylan/chitin deacetylase (PgdA/CDA1 family) [Sphingobium sp. B8D3C]
MENIFVSRLVLPQVTLCAATSVNVAATLRALEASLDKVEFAECKLFTDAPVKADHPGITVVHIGPLCSTEAYSDFVLSHMVDHIETSHCLISQWDGHVLNAQRWRPEFLEYDYIGARWPQFADGHDVGNGGFSLRSRRLMEACREPGFNASHVEDIAIGRTNRKWLEDMGLCFAPPQLADVFATERAGDLKKSFGYHGVWHMPRAIGVRAFWQMYRDLDNKGTVRADFVTILKEVGNGAGGAQRVTQMIFDYMIGGFGRPAVPHPPKTCEKA